MTDTKSAANADQISQSAGPNETLIPSGTSYTWYLLMLSVWLIRAVNTEPPMSSIKDEIALMAKAMVNVQLCRIRPAKNVKAVVTDPMKTMMKPAFEVLAS